MGNHFRDDDDALGWGDPRRCPRHGTVIGSPCGQYDGVCGECEGAIDDEGLREAGDTIPCPPPLPPPAPPPADDSIPF